LQGEHDKRGSQDTQAGYDGPEAAPTPRRLAVMGSRCRPVPQDDRKGTD
jgi:hypothetical protein